MVATEAVEREADGYHEAGHVTMTLCLGGTINAEGVEIDERQYCRVHFVYPRGDSVKREFFQVLPDMAGWRAEHLHHGLGTPRSDRKSAELEHIIWAVRDEASRHPDDEIEDGDDFNVIREMLLHNPDATDEELCVRYERYSEVCYALLRDSTIQTANAAVARALLKAGRLNFADVLGAIGGSADTLKEAAQRVMDQVGDPRD